MASNGLGPGRRIHPIKRSLQFLPPGNRRRDAFERNSGAPVIIDQDTSTARAIDSGDQQAWNRLLDRCGGHDFYHTPEYHAFHEARGQGTAVLIAHEEGDKVAAFPLLIRSLAGVPGLPSELAECRDATSVYGYGGPVTNTNWSDAAFIRRFGQTVRATLQSQGVIAAFSRLHPLLRNGAGLFSIGESRTLGACVSIDLRRPAAQQLDEYRDNHKWTLRRGRKVGMQASVDHHWKYFDDFIRLYTATMDAVKAQPWYRFDESYFTALRAALGDHLHLLVVKFGDRVISAGLFTICNGIIQYHLGGYDPDFRKFSPNTAIIDKARCWGNEQRADFLFLGGGVGAATDSLLHFKQGFSRQRHSFDVWRMVLQPQLYESAIEHHRQWESTREPPGMCQGSYFPAYRAHEQSSLP